MSSCQRFFGRPCRLEVRALVSSGFHLAARFDHLDSFCEATRRVKFHLCFLCALIQSSIVSRRSLSSASWVVRLMKSTQGSRQSSSSSGSYCKSTSVALLSASLSLLPPCGAITRLLAPIINRSIRLWHARSLLSDSLVIVQQPLPYRTVGVTVPWKSRIRLVRE